MQLNYLLTVSIIDTTPELDNVVALMQMIVQSLLAKLEAVTTSVDDVATFSGVACDSGGANVVVDFNAGVFAEWNFLHAVLSSSSASLADRFSRRARTCGHQSKWWNAQCVP